MDLSFGPNKKISIIIPTRILNEITKNNILVFEEVFGLLNIEFEIIVVSNNPDDLNFKSARVFIDNHNNAAISRNIGISKSFVEEGIFIFLDDDIVIEKKKLNELLNCIWEDNTIAILAPYLTGFYLENNFRLNKGSRLFYSWLSGTKKNNYIDIQGKSFYSYNFSPLYSESINRAQWATGGFLIFNNFHKCSINFESDIFNSSYYLEDFFITHEFFVKGIDIKIVPIIFEHLYLYKKTRVPCKETFIKCYNTELNRLKIEYINIRRTNETILKFKSSLIVFYLYRLKALTFKNFIELFAVIYLCLWKNRKY